MNFRPSLPSLLCLALLSVGASSCTVEKEAVFLRGASPLGNTAEGSETLVSPDPKKEAKLAADRARAVAEVQRKLAREQEIAAKRQARAAAKEARLAAKIADAEGRLFRKPRREVETVAVSGERGGFFSRFAIGFPSRRRDVDEHSVFVDHELVPYLTPANTEIEISLGEQRARLFHTQGAQRRLAIDTPVSTGKMGYETSPGTFRIQEKLEEKQSTLYGTWLDANGVAVPSNGHSAQRPPGASQFLGAEMPYWMRLHGGIGMHIGEVPGYPASHGCIRVPESVQPLIFSKVGLGTPVRVVR